VYDVFPTVITIEVVAIACSVRRTSRRSRLENPLAFWSSSNSPIGDDDLTLYAAAAPA